MLSAKKIIAYTCLFLVTFGLTYALLYLVFPYNKKPAATTIKVVGLWDTSVFQTLKTDFQAKNPSITIEYEKRPVDNYYSTLKASLDGKSGPDLFWWHSGWGPELLSELSPMPSSVMGSQEFEKTFYPIAKADLKWQGTFRGLPLEFDSLALLYNKTLLAKSNFSEPPRTWSSLQSPYVSSLTAGDRQRIVNSAIALGSANNVENASDILGLLFLQSGVDFIRDAKLTLASDKDTNGKSLAATTVDFYLDFNRKSRTWDNTLPNSLEAFAKGKTAMILLPAAKIPTLQNYLKEQGLSMDFGVAKVPQLVDSKSVNWGSYWAIGVGANSSKAKQAAAWKFAKYLVTPEALKTVYDFDTKSVGLGRVYPRVDMAEQQIDNPLLSPYLSEAPTAQSWFLQDSTQDEGLNDNLITELKKSITKLETGGSTEAELVDLEKRITPILTKYKLIAPSKEK
ncbi:MAG TPA: extracellular solute-binding protein [Candidatus Saccharimonadales bacterium]|nr:extracellular solute-binding protein [Candidatus Saccharimonadales bacterium]